MTLSIADLNLKKAFKNLDWKLLAFLVLFLNVKLQVKIPAIIIIYALQFNFRFSFSFKNSRLPLFYLLVIGVAFINLLFTGNYSTPNYLVTFFIGIGFWLLCVLAIHQVKLSVDNNDTEVLHNTVLAFFIINALVSFFTIGHIILEIHSLNPYRYQGQYQKYFIGTGDYIRGLSFDISTTNAVLNAAGVIYFLIRRSPVMMLICMAVLLLTGSNFINITLMLILTALFIFKTGKNQKSLIVVCLMFLVVFLSQVSPQSNMYVHETFKNAIHPPVITSQTSNGVTNTVLPISADSIKRNFARHYLDSEKLIQNNVKQPAQAALFTSLPKTDAGHVVLVPPNINTPPYQTPTDTTAEQRKLLAFIGTHKNSLPISSQNIMFLKLPGKVIGMIQSLNFLAQHPAKILTGDGVGNFSSKLAFRTTGLGFAGGFPNNLIYISREFLANHLDLYLNFFSKRTGLHSLTNSPFSVYDQLLTEYGLLGLVAFALFYIGFFIRDYKKLTYGIPLLVLLLSVLFIDYWFEQLSVIVFFELLLLLNIKENANHKPLSYEY
jgi:hypothetical protein